MQTIKFADGTVYRCTFCATDGNGSAFIALDAVTFPEAAAIFSDENMTSVMEWASYRLVGYTQLVSINVQPYGIQAMLRGGHDEAREQSED